MKIWMTARELVSCTGISVDNTDSSDTYLPLLQSQEETPQVRDAILNSKIRFHMGNFIPLAQCEVQLNSGSSDKILVFHGEMYLVKTSENLFYKETSSTAARHKKDIFIV